MPVMDGIQATRKIRNYLRDDLNLEREKQPKIIGVTGHVLEKFTSQGMKAGMDEVVAKPMYISILQDILDRYSLKRS